MTAPARTARRVVRRTRVRRQLAAPAVMISPVTLVAPVILSVMLVPANLYRLPSVLPFDVELYRLALFGVLIAWFTALLADPQVRLKVTPLDTALVLFAFTTSASLARNASDLTASGEFDIALKALIYVLSLMALFYAMVSLVRDESTALRLIGIVVTCGALLGVAATIERLSGFNVFRQLHTVLPFLQTNDYGLSKQLIRGGLRVAGSTEHPIAFGTMLALTFPFGLQLALTARTPRSMARWYVSTALILVGMLLTVSRTAFIGLFVTIVVFAVTERRHRTLLLVGLVAMSFVVHMAFPGVIRRFIEGLTPSYVLAKEVGNQNGRLEDYPRVFALYNLKPLFGRGIGTFTPDRFFYVDNQYLKFLVEIGLAGVLAVVALFGSAMRSMFRAGRRLEGVPRAMAVATGTSVLVFAASSATFDVFGFPQPTHLFFILLGLGVALVAAASEDAAFAFPLTHDRGRY